MLVCVCCHVFRSLNDQSWLNFYGLVKFESLPLAYHTFYSCGQSYKHFTLVNYDWGRNMGYFLVRYDSRVVNYNRRGFIRLATDSFRLNFLKSKTNLSQSDARPNHRKISLKLSIWNWFWQFWQLTHSSQSNHKFKVKISSIVMLNIFQRVES